MHDVRRAVFRGACLIVLTAGGLPAAHAAGSPPAERPASAPVAQSGGTGPVVSTLLNQASFWLSNGKPAEARNALSRLLLIDPKNEDALALLGITQADDGDMEAASTTLARLKAAHPASDQVAAIAARLKIGRLDPSTLTLARRLSKENHPVEAVAAYQKLFKGTTPTTRLAPEYYMSLAGTENGYGVARDGLLGLFKTQPKDANVALALAQLETYRQDTRRSGIERLEALVAVPSVAPAATQSWRQALLWEPDNKLSVPEMERFLVAYPNDTAIREKRQIAATSEIVDVGGIARVAGFSALDENKLAAAEEQFAKALVVNPEDFQAVGGMGIVRLRQRKPAEARVFLEKAAAEDSNWDQALKSAITEVNAPGTKTASAEAGAAIAAQYKRVENLVKAGHYAEAEKSLKKLMGRNPNWGSYTQLGDIQSRAGHLDDAEASLRKARSLNARDPGVAIALASVLERKGQLAEAQETLGHFPADTAAIGPAQAVLLRRMAAQEPVPAQQIALLQQSVEAAPGDPWARLALAQVLDQQNRHGEAELAMQGVGDGPRSDIEGAKAAIIYAQARGNIAAAGIAVARLAEQDRTPDMREVLQRAVLWGQIADATKGPSPAVPRLLELAAFPDPTGQRVVDITRPLLAENKNAATRAAVRAAMQQGEATTAQRLAYSGVLMQADDDIAAAAMLAPLNPATLSASDQKWNDDLQNGLAIRKAAALARDGNAAKGEAVIAERLVEAPGSADLNLAMSGLYLSDRRHAEALRIAETVMAKVPANLDARRVAVQAALGAGDQAKADALVAEGVQLAPDDPRSYLMQADAARAAGRKQTALAAMEHARAMRARQLQAGQN